MGRALTVFPRDACKHGALAWLGPPRHRFWGGEFIPPSKGDCKGRSVWVSIVLALRSQLRECASHPNLGEEGAHKPLGAPICTQLYDQDKDTSYIYC